ncbi:MAG: RHS repeat-associated core domain-containing protein, partial [Chthonomonadales bacterium]
SRIQTATYDSRGMLSTELDALGHTTTHLYSARREPINHLYMDGTISSAIYDARGLVTKISDWIGVTTETYDARGMLKIVNAPGHLNGQPLTTSYDGNGNRVLLETWWGPLTYGYDPRNLMSTVTDPGYPPRSTPSATTTYLFDARGMMYFETLPYGLTTTTTFDAVGRPLQIEHETGAHAAIDRAYYTYDGLGRPTKKVTGDGTYNYGYDLADRVITENNPVHGLLTWTYDNTGGIYAKRATQTDTSGLRTQIYDAADQLINLQYQYGAITTNTFDSNGSLITSQASPASTTTYTWDCKNRLTAATLPNGQIHTSTYRFDNLRYSHDSQSEGTEVFVWDRLKPDGLREMLARIGTNGGTTHLEVHGKNLSRYMGLRGDGAALNWMLQEDALQSVQSIIGIYGGSPASDGRFKTDAFGNNYAADLPGMPYEFGGGLGYWYDPDLGLNYVREQWYDPKSGTWLSVDPVPSEPRYSYVHQMPTVGVDPSGMQFVVPNASAPIYSVSGQPLNSSSPEAMAYRLSGATTFTEPGRAGYRVGYPGEPNAGLLIPVDLSPQERKRKLATDIGLLKKALLDYQASPEFRASRLLLDAESAVNRAVNGSVNYVGDQLLHQISNLLIPLGLTPKNAGEIIEELGKMGWALAVDIIGSFNRLYRSLITGWETFRHDLPPFLANIAPPLEPLEFAKYLGGFFVGLIKGLVAFIPLSRIKDVFDIIVFLIHNKEKGLWGSVKEYIRQIFNGLSSLFTEDKNLSSYQRGELAGGAFLTVVMLIIAVILAFTGVAEAVFAQGLVGAAKAFGRLAASKAKDLANAVKAIPSHVVNALRKIPNNHVKLDHIIQTAVTKLGRIGKRGFDILDLVKQGKSVRLTPKEAIEFMKQFSKGASHPIFKEDFESYLLSFTGKIQIRLARKGEKMWRYAPDADGKGRFLTKVRFKTREEAVSAMALERSKWNDAKYLQEVTITEDTFVLEGLIRDSKPFNYQSVSPNNDGIFFRHGVETPTESNRR